MTLAILLSYDNYTQRVMLARLLTNDATLLENFLQKCSMGYTLYP